MGDAVPVLWLKAGTSWRKETARDFATVTLAE